MTSHTDSQSHDSITANLFLKYNNLDIFIIFVGSHIEGIWS